MVDVVKALGLEYICANPGSSFRALHEAIVSSYHQELMHLQRMANRHNRGVDRAHIGTTIADPNIDYAKVAQGLGVYGVGPIDNPADLAPALKRAIAVVKRVERRWSTW
jgi:Thiamine pyrophosphate enzyme, C-terminal TPP binding domain